MIQSSIFVPSLSQWLTIAFDISNRFLKCSAVLLLESRWSKDIKNKRL